MIIDNSSVSHKGIVWGALPNQFTVTAYALDKNDVKFEYGNKFNIKDRSKALTILFLPVIGGLYRWIHLCFTSNTSGQMMKLAILFTLSDSRILNN